MGTHDCGGYTHAREFLLVVGARLGAVICYEDDLLACTKGQLRNRSGKRWVRGHTLAS